ncbi:AraC family transcriptional regulator, partial [Bacteroides sp. OttesenSCG-928-D19]|nr:AraC family transcriptional regulator [Bacteroides sp. OttesenSCG-928-D19]
MMNTPLNLILLNVGFSELNANWNWKDVYSPFARIYYIKGGRARMCINKTMHTLEPNRLYLIPPFTLHNDECDDYFALYYVHFYEKNIHKESIFDRYNFPVELEAGALDLMLIQRLLHINPDRHLKQIDPELYDNMPNFSQCIADNKRLPLHSILETQGILQQFTSRFLEYAKTKPGFKDSRIDKCLQYIHENTDKDISIAQLADLSCITEDHLIRIFKREMNCTPLKYINGKKMEKAQLLLLTTDLPVREVALELAIDNISYFNRMFKK